MGTARRIRKRIKRWCVFQLVRACAAVLGVLPLGWALALGALGGHLAFLLAPRLRRRAIEQLGEALGLPKADAAAVARAAFQNLGRTAVELARLPSLRRRLETYVELPEADRQLLREAHAEGRGVVFVSAHLGNWELLAQRVAAEGHAAVTLARRAPNPFLGHWLEARRAAGGVQSINRRDPKAARKILGAFRQGALVGVLIDQDVNVDSVHVPFFGRLASTPTAAAELALRRNAPVVVGFIRRRPGGHGVRLSRIDPGELDVAGLTARLTEYIEAAVRASPQEWVWFHDRWKTPPPT